MGIASTGQRPSQLARLTWADVDLRRRVVMVSQHSKRSWPLTRGQNSTPQSMRARGGRPGGFARFSARHSDALSDAGVPSVTASDSAWGVVTAKGSSGEQTPVARELAAR